MFKRIIALGVMFIMMFSLSACGDKDFVEVETDNMVNCSLFFYSPARNWIGDPIELRDEDENTVFECSVDKGLLLAIPQNEKKKSLKINSGDGLFWYPDSISDEIEQAFIDVVLKTNSNIIGYAVVEIYQSDYPHDYKAKLLKSSLLPKVNGIYQNVTKNQIKNAMKKIKDKCGR